MENTEIPLNRTIPDLSEVDWQVTMQTLGSQIFTKSLEDMELCLTCTCDANHGKNFMTVTAWSHKTKSEIFSSLSSNQCGTLEAHLVEATQKLLEVCAELRKKDFNAPVGIMIKQWGSLYGMHLHGKSFFMQMETPTPAGISLSSKSVLKACDELVILYKYLESLFYTKSTKPHCKAIYTAL